MQQQRVLCVLNGAQGSYQRSLGPPPGVPCQRGVGKLIVLAPSLRVRVLSMPWFLWTLHLA